MLALGLANGAQHNFHPLMAVRMHFSQVRPIGICQVFVGLTAIAIQLTTLLGIGFGVAPGTQPVDGIRSKTPQVHLLRGARVVVAPGHILDQANILIRDTSIVAVGSDLAVPADARVWDLSGKTVYAGLIDAYHEVDTQDDRAAANHWSREIRPSRAIDGSQRIDGDLRKKLRAQGVAYQLLAPADGILRGSSAMFDTSDDPANQSLIRTNIAQHARLTIRSTDRKTYPNSPMGAVALARQAVLDSQWYRQVWQAYESNPRLPRPERNIDLAYLADYLGRGGQVVFDTADEQYLLRAHRFAQEFGIAAIMRGSGDEYRRLDAVVATGRDILLPVNFPDAPYVATPESATDVSLERLLHWELAPENPARLADAGARFAFTSHGLKEPQKFLAQIRVAIEHNLSSDNALRALTTNPAEMFGLSDIMGTVAPGKLASLCITDGDLFAEKTKVQEVWIRGKRFEIEPEPLVDPRGVWRLQTVPAKGSGKDSPKPRRWAWRIAGTPEKLTGELDSKKKGDDAEESSESRRLHSVRLEGRQLYGHVSAQSWGRDGFARWRATLAGVTESGDQVWSGVIRWPDGQTTTFRAEQSEAEQGEDDQAQDETDSDVDSNRAGSSADEFSDKKQEKRQKENAKDSFVYKVNYPLGAFGRGTPPEQPERVALVNGVIWTSGPEGVIENGRMIVGGGKILAVGAEIPIPNGTRRIDLKGQHVTPGIIDCHSHMATDGGLNESTQAITAEVRIGDFIDATDINIYRQLAGGVTTANVLHGSANPIGGQNRVIKLRWGALGEELVFRRAPAGIKFALGENVKQSNWGEEYTTRYPQTRMGVPQIIRDALLAAAEYDESWTRWRTTHSGLPPRRDLEMEALGEVLAGKRWIHCHSYRQDEILALLRTLEEFDVTIGTLQHILEGYKVADAMARHGAMGSSFSDWWAYKFEVFDAIPYNGALMHKAGVVVSFNSDDAELARHLNQEAAKAVKYGGVPPRSALQFVTLNPARQLRIDAHVGSLEVGKDADFAIWSGPPLSNYSSCQQTWIDGRKYFDRLEDQERRQHVTKIRSQLIQKILQGDVKMQDPGDEKPKLRELWPREDVFCHRHDDHGRSRSSR